MLLLMSFNSTIKSSLTTTILLCSFLLLNAKKAVPQRDFEIRLDETEDWMMKGDIRYSKDTGYPLGLYGLSFQTQGGTPEKMAMEYIHANKDFLGLREKDISELKLHFIRESDAGTTVRLRQYVDGFPVGRSEITINIDFDNIVRYVMNSFRQHINLESTNPLITAQYARAIAHQKIGLRGKIRFDKTKLMVYWNKNFVKLCYEVRASGDSPSGDWQILVDAMTGEFVKVVDMAHYHKSEEERHESESEASMMAVGTGSVFDADPLSSAGVFYGGAYVDNGDLTNASLQAEVQNYVMQDITFSGGIYSLNGPYAVITEWEPPAKGDFSQASSAFTFNREDDGFEATNCYYHIDYSMRYLNVTLGCNIMPRQYAGGVQYDPHSVNGADNSHFSSGTGELCFGEGCVDDAEDSDVIHHELGHGLHDWVTNGGLSQNEGLSEGCGDYWAGSYNRGLNQWTPSDPQYYWMFNWDGHNACWAGRQLNVTGYPGALINQVHTDGQLWASCLMTIWDEVGQQDLDKAFWEGLGMTNGASNQNDAAVAVYQAAINLNYSVSDIIAMHDGFTACGYTLPALATIDVAFTSMEGTIVEGNECGTQTIQTMVSLRNAPDATTTVNFSVGGTAGTGDFTTSPASLTFTTANWDTDQAVDIIVSADGAVEGDETVILTITSVTGSNAVVGVDDTYTLTITDDDLAPQEGLINQVVFSDDLNSGLANWTITDGADAGDTWNEYSTNNLDGTTCLFVTCPATGNKTLLETVESIAVNTAGLSNVILSFDQYFRADGAGFNETTNVDIWDGTTWQNVYTRDGNNDGSLGAWNTPNTQSIDITAHANAAMKVRFVYSANRDFSWAIDNVSISGDALLAVQSAVNSGTPSDQQLGPNQTVHFYDDATGNVMCTIQNLSAHDYGCTSVYVESAGTATMQVADYATANQLFFNKTFRVVPTNNNAAGNYTITFYLTDAEKTGWESAGIRTWSDAEVVKTTGSITSMTNITPFVQAADSRGTFNMDHTITATFGTGFSGFGFAQALPPLPVELIGIKATPNRNAIDLEWSTASEINNSGFEVQRSLNPNDGFEKIAWVEGKGNSAEVNTYLLEDKNVRADIVYYYRLKQIDFDGAFEYSDIVNAKIDTHKSGISIYPNPAVLSLNINFVNPSSEVVKYRILDVSGKIIGMNEAVIGNENLSLDISHLAKGVYLITLEMNGEPESFKFIKE